jgi:MSHA biogenesis protein MshJ
MASSNVVPDQLHDRLHGLRRRTLDLSRRFDARPQRERIAMLLAALAVVLLLADRLWLSPAFHAFSQASQALASAQGEQQALNADAEQRRVQGDANRRALDTEIAQWRQRTSQGAQALAGAQAGLIGPDRMAALLEQMLPRHGGVKVVGLASLAPQDARMPLGGRASAPAAPLAPAAPMALPPAAAAAVPVLATALTGSPAATPATTSGPTGAPLYRHGVEITVEGGYGELMAWLWALENLPGPRLLWGGVKLNVEQHPTVRLSLTVYTLSLDRAWLEL